MDVLFHHTECPACGSPDKPEPIYRKGGYDILRYSICDLGSTAVDDRFDPVVIYSSDYFQVIKLMDPPITWASNLSSGWNSARS
jgi:hypothetical protein